MILSNRDQPVLTAYRFYIFLSTNTLKRERDNSDYRHFKPYYSRRNARHKFFQKSYALYIAFSSIIATIEEGVKIKRNVSFETLFIHSISHQWLMSL